jgi:hypothetical protein
MATQYQFHVALNVFGSENGIMSRNRLTCLAQTKIHHPTLLSTFSTKCYSGSYAGLVSQSLSRALTQVYRLFFLYISLAKLWWYVGKPTLVWG